MSSRYTLQQSDDNELLLKFQNGNRDALGLLFKKYLHQAYGVALKYLKDPEDSKDAVMHVFEKLQNDLLKHNVRNFKSWLHTVVRNHCLMELRRRKGLHFRPLDENDSPVSVEFQIPGHPANEFSKENLLSHMENGIKELKEEHRKCLELFYLSEKSYQEVSEITGYTLLQVKSYIQNGKRNLKIYLEKIHAG